jgi:hypothetical protein
MARLFEFMQRCMRAFATPWDAFGLFADTRIGDN